MCLYLVSCVYTPYQVMSNVYYILCNDSCVYTCSMSFICSLHVSYDIIIISIATLQCDASIIILFHVSIYTLDLCLVTISVDVYPCYIPSNMLL